MSENNNDKSKTLKKVKSVKEFLNKANIKVIKPQKVYRPEEYEENIYRVRECQFCYGEDCRDGCVNDNFFD